MINDQGVSGSVVVVLALMGSVAALLTIIVVVLFVEPARTLTIRLITAHQRLDDSNKKMQLSADEETQQVIAWREIQMLKFNDEQKAPIWAEQTQNQLMEQFQRLNDMRAQQGYDPLQVNNVECRFSMCVVILRWDNIELAREASAIIAGFNYRLPCATSSLVYDSPEKFEDVNYRHEVIFRCKRNVEESNPVHLSQVE